MPSFAEELARMIWLSKEGKVDPEERCKLIFPRLEAKRRVKNTEGRTRLVVQLDTPATSASLRCSSRAIKELTGNPQIAFTLMIRLLAGLSDDAFGGSQPTMPRSISSG